MSTQFGDKIRIRFGIRDKILISFLALSLVPFVGIAFVLTRPFGATMGDLLTKPINDEDLVKRLENVLRTRNSTSIPGS